MFSKQDYRDNPLNWALPVGRAFNIRIRVHVLFIIWIVFDLLHRLQQPGFTMDPWLIVVTMYFVIVLLHEFGHCFGARAVGGEAVDILMWPLGGLASVDPPMRPWAHFITAAAGPAVNLLFCLLALLTALVIGRISAISFNPLQLFAISSGQVIHWTLSDWLSIFWSVNYLLILFNLLPTFPMDGGRLLQAVLWRYSNFNQSILTATFVGMVGAVIYALVGAAMQNMILLAIGGFGYLTCMQQRQRLKSGELMEENEFGYDFSRGYRSLPDEDDPRRRPSWWTRHRLQRMARRQQREREQTAERERLVDDILSKVREQGMHSLTAREKRILQQETERKKKT
ncbi:MAG: hypothetical protein HJJLKODD_03027 [Phycisphaerae bacterium]|nr:hypothetical protein [Phycisphaerae bacterium]